MKKFPQIPTKKNKIIVLFFTTNKSDKEISELVSTTVKYVKRVIDETLINNYYYHGFKF
jgi:DNA-directed RNA polymerase specialized sigma subunit